MKKLLYIILLVGLFLTSCNKNNVEPEAPVVTTPTEPEEEKKYLLTGFRLKVYYTKLNLKDTTYITTGNFGSIVEVGTKVVLGGDTSILNFREGKYDLIDSTDYYTYQSAFKYDYDYVEKRNRFMPNDRDLFYNLYKEGYIHKVVVEMSNISGIDYVPNRIAIVTKSVFLREFENETSRLFKTNFLKRLANSRKPLYYIEDLIEEPVDTDVYLEFKDVPYYY